MELHYSDFIIAAGASFTGCGVHVRWKLNHVPAFVVAFNYLVGVFMNKGFEEGVGIIWPGLHKGQLHRIFNAG